MACTNKSRIFFLSFSLEVRRVQASALAKPHSQKLAVNRKETTARLLSCSRPNFVSGMLAPVFRSFRCCYCHWLPRYTSPSSSSVTWVARSDRGLYVPALLAGIFLYGRKRSGRKLYGLLGASLMREPVTILVRADAKFHRITYSRKIKSTLYYTSFKNDFKSFFNSIDSFICRSVAAFIFDMPKKCYFIGTFY